jgi:repressor LexA
MHEIQKNLLSLSRNTNLGDKSLREIGGLIGVNHPQKISHHLMQLEKKGFIVIDRSNGIIKNVNSDDTREYSFINVPIVGSANCGPAQLLAEENLEGHLKISRSMAPSGNIFAIRAQGDSMNKARINGKSIDDGDFVIVDKDRMAPHHGDYVLSIVDDAANIKRFHHDHSTGQLALISESTYKYPPIYIHEDDTDSFMINGTVVDVIKQPKF